jgi:hypothetical protein
MSFKQPTQILGKSSVLKHLYAHAKELLVIQELINKHVKGEIHVAAIKDGTLHLVAQSSAVATQLRYRRRNLIALLRHQHNIDNLKVSVQPFEPPKTDRHPSARLPSAKNAKQLADTAKYIEDEGLRKALITLSKRGLKS